MRHYARVEGAQMNYAVVILILIKGIVRYHGIRLKMIYVLHYLSSAVVENYKQKDGKIQTLKEKQVPKVTPVD